MGNTLQHTAPHSCLCGRSWLYFCMCTHSLCNTVTHCKHNATNCNTQHTATHFSTRLCSRSLVAVILRVHTLFVSHGNHCNILQHSATCCNNLQQTVTHCNIIESSWSLMAAVLCILPLCVTLQHAATRCNTLQHTAIYCNALNALQRTPTNYISITAVILRLVTLLITRQKHCNTL